MIGLDWTDYVYHPAPRSLLCQFRRYGDGPVQIAYAKDFSSYFNVAGLEWKLTGIARMELDRMTDEQKRKMFRSMPGNWVWWMTGNQIEEAGQLGFIPGQLLHVRSGCDAMMCYDKLRTN